MTKNQNHRLLYAQDQLPIFQNRMYDSKVEAELCPKGDMRLVEDLKTGLVYNLAFRQELMNYDGSYQNEQALSSTFKDHLMSVSEIIKRTMGLSNLVEVGCGKGYFLEVLLSSGFDITGFDPTYEGSNQRIHRSYFDPSSAITGEGLILRHVLEHIKDPIDFLLQLKASNGGGGKIYIEVPCFDWICEKSAWFDIFYEHVNYFRLTDFYRIFGQVIESGHLFGGQYIYVVAELSSLRLPQRDTADAISFPKDFSAIRSIADIHSDSPIVIWGGASKGVIFALLMTKLGIGVSTVIDINPAKQGHYLPGTGILVQSPEDALPLLKTGQDLYVMNSNYFEEIKKLSFNRFNYIRIDHG
ncbi:methyltransferase domain-containing protein [Polynucleobacter paneuropaeus]|nr:methyltransferase domain-containing protein [Polynucleobacter paneuropaeus]MBT8583028.1 methyltransferase domain-containing protein [Polynucleobacter paneuropaeus]